MELPPCAGSAIGKSWFAWPAIDFWATLSECARKVWIGMSYSSELFFEYCRSGLCPFQPLGCVIIIARISLFADVDVDA